MSFVVVGAFLIGAVAGVALKDRLPGAGAKKDDLQN